MYYCVWILHDEDFELLDCDPVPAEAIPALLLVARSPLLFLLPGELPP